MPRQRIQQRKRPDEKSPLETQLTNTSSVPSPFSIQRQDDRQDSQNLDGPQKMPNPKLQLQQSRKHGFNLNIGPSQVQRTSGAIAPPTAHAVPSSQHGLIQSKAIDNPAEQLSQQSSQQPSQAQSNPSHQLLSRAIQAKKDDALIQRKATFQQGLAYVKAGKSFKPLEEWEVSDFIEVNKSMRSIAIKNRTKFEIFAHFAESELSDENTNCLLLLSKINWSNEKQLYAAAELFSQQIMSNLYRYQTYLPQVQYPTKRSPEEINVSYQQSCALTQYYIKLHEAMDDSDKKHKDLPIGQYDMDAINSQVDAHIGLCNALMSIGITAYRLLSMDTIKRFHKQTYATLFPKAYKVSTLLGRFYGGARKRRILGGYHEAEDRELNQEE